MSNNLKDVFGSSSDYLDEVIILPWDSSRNSGSFNLPAGYTWDDFEYVEFMAGNTGASSQIMATNTLDKIKIQSSPNDWDVLISYEGGYFIAVEAESSTSFSLNATGSTMSLGAVKGYTKRYATRNHSAVVNVNGGANIGVNQRYEIDIATELGSEYVGRDLVVVAEVFNNSGSGVSGWGDSCWFFNSSNSAAYGTKATTFGDKIVVQTGTGAIASNSSRSGNAYGIGAIDIASAPCRVKVWKVEQYITPTAVGGAGKTVLYDGPLVENGDTVILLDDITKYDDIKIYGISGGTTIGGNTFEPVVLLDPSYSSFWVSEYQTSNYVQVSSITNTTMDVLAGGAGQGVTRVIGINYS